MDNMSNHEEKDTFEEPELKLENEALPAPETKLEPAVVIGDEIDDVGEDTADESDNDVDTAPPSTGFPIRSFNAGDIVFQEGDPGIEAYLILNGQVEITRRHKKKRIVVNQLGKDQIFGEMAIITGDPRTATAEAMEPTELFIITENKLNENLSQRMAIVKSLIDQLIERMKQLLKQQSTFLSKVEQAMQKDKKLEQLKAQADKYAQTKTSDSMEEGLRQLLERIRQM